MREGTHKCQGKRPHKFQAAINVFLGQLGDVVKVVILHMKI